MSLDIEKQLNNGCFKEVSGFSDYIMSLSGKVIRKSDGYELKVFLNNGYYSVSLKKDGKWTIKGIHEIKAKTFLSGWKESDHVHHINENKLDNGIDNLQCLSVSEHIKKHTTGEKNPNFGKHRSEETKRKISLANKGKKMREETKHKLSEINKGKTLSDEIKRKISEGNKGKIFNKERRCKISEALKGKKRSKKTRQKLSLINKGKFLGEKSPNSKISNQERLNIISEIKQLHKAGLNFTKCFKQIANKYPISTGTIQKFWYEFQKLGKNKFAFLWENKSV